MRPILSSVLILSAAVLCCTTLTHAQSCPDEATGTGAAPSALHGTVIYHEELREWLGLRLDRPACGEGEVQLVFPDAEKQRQAKALRQCVATVTGTIYYGQTGYYSAKLAVSVDSVKPDASCHPQPVEPDPTVSKIPADLGEYRASLTIDYRGKGHVLVEVWKDPSRLLPLKPWQAYVSYFMNGGGDVVYFGCRDGYQWNAANQTPKSSHDIANFTNGASAVLDDSVSPNVITFTCEKARKTSPLKR